MAFFSTNEVSNDVWFVNSGCLNHMTDDISLFKELDE